MESKLQILALMKKAGTFEATWRLLRGLEEEVEKAVTKLEGETGESNPVIHLLLRSLRVPPPRKGGSGRVD